MQAMQIVVTDNSKRKMFYYEFTERANSQSWSLVARLAWVLLSDSVGESIKYFAWIIYNQIHSSFHA